MKTLSQQIRELRDALGQYEPEGRYFAPEAIDAVTRMLTAFAARAVGLERGTGPSSPATLRIAATLERQGVKRGAAAQPPLSCAIQDVAELLHGHFHLGDRVSPAELVARLNQLSADAWSLEEKAAGVTPPSELLKIWEDYHASQAPAAGHRVDDPKIINIAEARRERNTP